MNKININRENLSNAEIEKFKDFRAIENKFVNIQNKPLLKNIWIKTSMYSIIAGVICIGVWKAAVKKDTEKTGVQTAFINPPLPQYDIPYKTYLYNSESDTIIKVSELGSIELKKNSLVDSTGKTINGVAEIRYREFMDPTEIFLSGVPMNYDSAGKTMTFQSAGMIEIHAFQNNKPLFIAPGKPVKVSFISKKSESDYSLYYLDTIKKNWVYKGKNEVTIGKLEKTDNKISNSGSKNLIDSLNSLKAGIAKLQKPEIPAKADPKKWHFKLDVLPKEFPELSGYSNTLFEIDETYKPLNPGHSKIEWTDVSVEKAQKPLYYFVTFTRDTIKCKYRVHPVLSGKSFETELSNYEKKYKAYQQELAKRKQQEQILSQQLLAPVKYQYADTSSIKEIWATENNITRSFGIMSFGVWNCDRPFVFNTIIRKPSYKLNDTVYKNEVFLADYKNNLLERILPDQELKYDKSAKNLLIMVIGKKRIAVFRPKDFSKLTSLSGSYVFEMKLINGTFKSNKELINRLNGELLN